MPTPENEPLPTHLCQPSECAEPSKENSATVLSSPLPPVVARVKPPTTPPAIPGYDLLEILGRGGMGVVYKAREQKLNRLVAVKMILGGLEWSDDLLPRFRAEAEALARLQHPNVVQIHDIGEYREQPYFVLEYCAGGSLSDHLKAGPLSPREAATLIATLARAMHAVHQAGIVHRDLKPANVLLQEVQNAECRMQNAEKTAEGRAAPSLDSALCTPHSALTPKITDFGLARLVDQTQFLTREGDVMGTPGYMAPEQASGQGHMAGPAADVYALGAILYECLTGRPPFLGKTVAETLLWVLTEDPLPPRRLNSSCPADLETICLKCLEKDARSRYRTAADLADDLQRFLDDRPILAQPAPLLARLRRFVRRHRSLVGGVLGVFVALVLGIIGTSVGLIQARADRQRADEARADALEEAETRRRLLVESYAQAARLAMRRGAWEDALMQLDRALQEGHPKDVALHFARARAYQATHQINLARQELQALAGRSDLGRSEGQVLLWYGDMLLDQHKPEGRQRVQEALRKYLPPAEQAFARGLLAASSTEAVKHFEQAIELDPFHHKANVLAVAQRLFLGQRQNARERIDFARRIFPDDPTFVLQLAFLLTLEGKKDEGMALLDRVSKGLTEPQRRTARATLEMLAVVALFNNELDGTRATSTWQAVWHFTQATLRLRALAQAGDRSQLSMPLPATFREGFKIVSRRALDLQLHLNASSLPRFVRPNPAGLLADLEAAEAAHPDGLIAFVRGAILVNHERWSEAERALARAAEQSSLFHVRQPALWFGALCAHRVALDKARAGAKREARQAGARAIRSVRALVQMGEVRPDWADGLIVVALGNDEIDLARHILREWELRQPNDPAIGQARLDVEARAGAWARVIETAQQRLAKQPGDRKIRQTLDHAREQLRQQAARLAPEPQPRPR